MSDIIVDGRTAVWFLPTIASAALQPTVAEIAAGHRISKWMPPTGLEGFMTEQGSIDTTSIESTTDTNRPGRKSYPNSAVVLKKQTGDAAYTAAVTAMAESTDGYIVIRDDLLATAAVVAAQPVEVYTIVTGEHANMGRGETNSLSRKRIPTPVSGLVNRNAVVLA